MTRISRRTRRPRRIRMGVGILLTGATIHATFGQEFEVRVKDVVADVQRLVVPLDRSVIIETNIEVARVHTVAGHLVGVEPIGPRQLMVTGMGYGTTQVILWGPDDRQSVLEISVELNLQPLQQAALQIDPQARVEARSVLGNIVLQGTVSSAETAEKLVELARLFLPPAAQGRTTTTVQNHLRVAGEQQVVLRCTVAEVNRSAARELGINGFLAGDDFRDMFVVNQIGSINPANIGAAADTNVLGEIPFMTGTEGVPLSPSTTLSLGFPRVQMQLFLQSLANNSLLKILAEPNLVCLSGETATFLAGGEFPIPVPQSTASNAITIEFREFGVRLSFTPVVQAHQMVRLRINPEVSETDFSAAVEISGFVVPGLTRRSAETTVEVGSGQTIAIAGLLSEEVRAVANRVPGLGDLPVLGALFRSVEFRKNNTELVILVTPEIVSPLDPDQVSQPAAVAVTDPSDFELYGLGRLEGTPRPINTPLSAPSGGLNARPPQPPSADLSPRGAWGYADAPPPPPSSSGS